jgi:hypothetical protein
VCFPVSFCPRGAGLVSALCVAASVVVAAACGAPGETAPRPRADDAGVVVVDPEEPLAPGQIRRGSATQASRDLPPRRAGDAPTPPADVDLVDLGTVDVGEDGASGTILVDVDERIQGLTLVVLGQPDALVMVTRVEAADGAVVVDDAEVDPATPGFAQARNLSRGFASQFFSPGRVLPARRIGAFPVPSSIDVPLRPGRWTMRVGHFTAGVDDAGRPAPAPLPRPVQVWVLVRRTPPAPGHVGLALHFTGAGGLSAGVASTSPRFADALSLTRTVFGGVGVDVGDVVYDDLDDGAALRTIVLDEPTCDGGDLDELVARGRPDRVNVFFVERFECGSVGPFLLGMSPGIPGVPWSSSTPSSGVVVAGTWLDTNPDRFAVTLAHELGHWLGLFHTQENDRFGAALYDNIDDTAEAPGSRANLMFFDVSRIDDEALTAGQSRTLQRGATVLP